MVASAVREMADYKSSARGFTNAFVKGAAPGEAVRKRFAPYIFAPAGGASISGEGATIKVKVIDEKSDNVVGEVEWTYVQEGGQWKLKAAPLP